MLDLYSSSPRPPTENPGFLRMFRPGRLTVGVFFPIEAFRGDRPEMAGQIRLARRAEQLGFAALWFRDVPLRVREFGDVGQVFDPWVYLGHVLSNTRSIALATGAIVLPLRHPLHTAKAAASVDRLSGGRLVLGVASGDRPVEFPAFGVDLADPDESFRENLCTVQRVLRGEPIGAAELVPKPFATGVPVLMAGRGGQTLDWIAGHVDGWVSYPRDVALQRGVIKMWRTAVDRVTPERFKPFAQSLYIDLGAQADQPPSAIHLGYRLGHRQLVSHLEQLAAAGVNHVALNLKYGSRPADEVLEELGEFVLPQFQPKH